MKPLVAMAHISVLLILLPLIAAREQLRDLEVSEGVPVGTRIGFIGDGMSSNTAAPYLIVTNPGSGVDSDLILEQNTGEIRTRVLLDRETRASYSLVAIPQSGGENIRVIVRVQDENDNAPTFPAGVMHIEFPENTPRDVKRTLHPARDLDLGIFNTQRYNIVSGNVNNAFRLSSHRERDGVLYLDLQINGFLDRETTAFYSLVIEALDGGSPPLKGSMSVNITIQDVNDNQPIFNQSRYFATIPENATVGTNVLQVFATDADAGNNGHIEYSINRRQSDKEAMFKIDPNTGQISVNRPLDFETKEIHELVIVAKDAGVQPLETTAFVSIRVTDVNDNQPTINVIFLSDDATPKISESAQPGEFVARINVNDPDSKTDISNVTVTLQGGEGHFGLESRDNFIYLVIVSLPIDREMRPNYTLSVIATDMGSPPLHASKTFHLRVTDVNDNAPEFDKPMYYANVLEVADPGTSVFQITARDRDECENSMLSYSILETPETHANWFQIDSRTGLITTRAHVDCETDPVPQLTVVAKDSGTPPLSSSATVLVTIHDVNDNEPIFDQTFYNVSVPESEDVGHCILKVSATDPDCGVNAMVNYTIGDLTLYIKEFEIKPVSGTICLTSPLDYEKKDSYEFPVLATDRGGLSTTAIVKVQVIDVNDNRPQFYPREYNVSLTEGVGGVHSSTAQPIVVVVATDADSGKFGTVTYRIVAGNEENLFRIDRSTGELFLVRPNMLSSRIKPYHVLNVSATDGAGLKSASDAKVFLSVTDAARRPPLFERTRYTFSIPEDVERDEVVGAVKASSHGSRDSIRYSIHSGDPDGCFAIDPDLGVIRTAVHLDHEVHPSVVLNVQAKSGDPPTYSHTQVNIIIEDVNDNAPEFDSSAVRISVPENVEVGVPLYEAHARDRDSGKNSLVRYRLASSGLDSSVSLGQFAIDSRLGHLTLVRPLDYETKHRHTLTIVASDTGVPSLSSNMTLFVEVQDVNDNTPVFERSEYSVSVLESMPVNSQVAQVTAVDHDTGNNARLTYRLKVTNGTDSTDVFGIFPNTGLIYLKRTLDRESRDRYVLTVAATDNGTPADFATTLVIVTVLDANDNNPTFLNTSYEFFVEENSPSGTYVGKLLATDPDLDNNAMVHYSFTPGNFSFRLNPTSGEITTGQPLDREDRETYELLAEARDQGVPPRSTWISVRIIVKDVNDNAPELVDPREDVISVREQQPPGTEVTRLKAVDKDSGPNATITYSIVKGRENDGYGIFTVDPTTGTIRTRFTLDHEERSIYRLAVAASDGGKPPLQTVRLLRVEVLDLSDHRPTFTSSSLLFKVREDVGMGYIVGTVAATDDNAVTGRIAGNVRYSLTSTSTSSVLSTKDDTNAFEIDKSTGHLVVARKLDRETQTAYQLEVRALDMTASNNPQSSAITVKIDVVDVNDNAPKWPSNPVILELPENIPVNTVISNISANDQDTGVNADLRYSLVKSYPDSGTFSIDALTGIITLNNALDFETITEYLLVVQATDQAANVTERLSTSTTFIIRVIDVNDNAPSFVSPSEPLPTADRLTEGSILGTVIAVDRERGENGRITYNFSSAEKQFVINSETGVVSASSDLVLPRGLIKINVTATDHGVPPMKKVFPLKFQVRGTSDSPPKFSKSLYEISVAENVPTGTFLVRVEASIAGDNDGRGNLSYRIPHGVAHNLFVIDPIRGTVSTRGLLDREQQSFYNVPVYVSLGNSAPSDVTILSIKILDVNDHPPSFVPGSCYNLRVPENSDLAVIHKVIATDPDLGPNGEVTYTIAAGNLGNKFSIDLHTGLLTARPLDREAHASYKLVLVAQDRGSPPLQGTCNITIIVEDANDNDPQFTQSRYSARLSEDAPLNTAVLSVQANDADSGINSRIVYSLANESHWLFKVDNKTGVITTTGHFDREKKSVYEFQVVATDGGRYDARSQKVPVIITITDVNDNKPIFISHPFTAQVAVYTPAGSNLVKVLATDADDGTNADIVYSFVNEPSGSKFKINPTTGWVTASSSLSPELGKLFHLEVLARDRGNPPQSAIGLVEIRVGEMGDAAASLRFRNRTYHVVIPENAPPGRDIIQVSAVRSDGRLQRMRYSFGAGNHDSAFSIHSDSGLIRIRDSAGLDYEMVHERVLIVVAEVDGPLYGYCEVRVSLEDKNDNAPKFTQEQYTASVWEGNNKGTFVMQVSATDVDTGVNAHILYHIVDGNHDNAFVIEPPFSGIVKTNIVLDREIRDSYRLTIIATDEGSPQKTGTSTLLINIVDANDNQPTFPPHSVISIGEGTKLGNILTVVTANDVDTNPALTYAFADGSTMLPEFSIDRFSGKLLLGKKLDYELRSEYKLTITASDTAHTAQTILTIQVVDENDNAPVFSKFNYQVVIRGSSTDTAQPLLVVNATDADSGKNAEIRYSLAQAPSGLTIDSSSGEIFVNRTGLHLPDDKKFIEVIVEAEDLGEPSLKDYAVVTIAVADDPKTTQFLTQDEFQIRIREDTPIGTSILKVATPNQVDTTTRFVIFSGNDEGLFQMLSPGGELILVKPPDRERRNSYTLRIRTGLTESNNATIHVTIDDANDNAPQFQDLNSAGGYEASISEFAPMGASIFIVYANDTDLPGSPNSELWYEIIAGNDRELFLIESRTGIVRVKNPLDCDFAPSLYLLMIRVSDSARSPDRPLSSVAVFNVTILDENDNAPKFPVKEYLEFVSENEPVGTSVFTARAVDFDASVFGKFNYSISPADECSRLFKIEPSTGVVSTNSVFDYETQMNCVFGLVAVDYGGKSTKVQVQIQIESRDEFAPQFTERTYRFVVPAGDLPIGYVIGFVRATDRDKGVDGRVVYMLTSQHKFFKVNRTTGAVMLKNKLFADIADPSFIITASSGKQGSLANTTIVEVAINPLTDHGTNLASNATVAASGGLADWALGLLIALIFIILVFGAVFLFLHMRNRRHKKVNKPALASSVGSSDFVDSSGFDTIPIRGGGGSSQFAPPKYDEIPTYRNTSSSGNATTSELSGSEQSNSSGRGSAEDGEDVEDEEIRMINEGPLQRDGPMLRAQHQSDGDNISDVSVHNTQEYLARLGIVDNTEMKEPIEGMHMFEDENLPEADLTNLIYSKLNDVGGGSERGANEDSNLSDHVILGGFDVPVSGVGTQQPSMTGSLSSIVHSEEELTGSYNWDYLLDWGPQYQPLAHVFSEIARLKDDTASVQSANSGSSSSKSKTAPKTLPPPLLTSVAPPRVAVAPPSVAPRSTSSSISHHSSHHVPSSSSHGLLLLPRSPISHDSAAGFSSSAAMSPSFSPSLSPLATRSPSISPLVTPGHHPRPTQRTAAIADAELRI